MTRKAFTRVVAVLLTVLMLVGIVPLSATASIANWEDNNVVYDGETFGTNGYYNVISKKDYVLVPGAAVESEMVLNNAAGTRRQVLHIIEVDPSNPDVSIVPGYYQIDKDLTDEANWSHKELTEMAKYYEETLGYNIVGGMNTDLYYDTYAPRVLVYNGQDLSIKGKTNPTSSILYVFKDAEGTISCDVRAFNRTEFDNYLASGTLLHAIGVSFGMTVKDGKLVSTAEERTSAAAARSMVGIKPDGTLVLCMNDGRGANNSVGFNNYELGESMLALGCQWAANCDGGGSSTFITKRVGEEDFTMRSVPCDGAQRPTAHGIFITSNVAPTGVLDVINVTSDYDYFAPYTTYKFGAEAIDTHGYGMDMPADATWALSDASYGVIADGEFISSGKVGTVDVQVLSGGAVVGTKTITVADPEIFELSATSTVIPYSTPEKIRTITLPIVAKISEANVYIDAAAVSVSLSNAAAGTLDGFKFTATEDTSITGVDVTVTYNATGAALVYEIEFGKGSEVIYDFEDGDRAGFMGFEEAKKWSQDNGVNNTLVGSDPLAGQFNEYLSSETFMSSTTNGGQVRNGNYALAWRLDNTDAAFASWSYNVLFNTGETIVLRDVANGKKATTLGMWLYIPEEAFQTGTTGVAFQSQFYTYQKPDGTYGYPTDEGAVSVCQPQQHFYFTSAATGARTNLNSATNADIPESRWVYVTMDLTKASNGNELYYVCTSIADSTSNTRTPSFIRTYVKPTFPADITFYIDDITLDYSSAVDDRILPVISAPTYSTSDTAITLDNGATINGNKIAFSATVTDNSALDMTSGKIFVDGVEIAASVNGSTLSSKEDAVLFAGVHTVAFEVKDELGNPARITRTFTVAGDATVSLGGHNDSGATPKAQSIYYVDINAADLSAVKSLTAVLKLQNANTWETVGAVVAEGFKATFDYNEVSQLLTVEIEAVGGAKAEAGAIVSIPVRVWTFDRYNYVNNTYYAPSDMGNKPVVNVDCEVTYGYVTLNDKSASAFGGSINVATELTTISSPYHIHDTELTVLGKAPTCSESGYENRTYCETCQSVVDWGTILPALGHAYERVDTQFVCTVCGDVYASGTGIFEMNGDLYYSINGVLQTGWQYADSGYCFADATTYKLCIGELKRPVGTFVFGEDGILAKGAWYTNSAGKKYYYGPAYYSRTWAEIDGNTYYFDRAGYMFTGVRFVKDNPDVDPVWYVFGEDGVLDENGVVADGLYEINGDYYIVKDGQTQHGLYYIDGAYYFGGVGSGFDRAGACAINQSVTITAGNSHGLLPAGTYEVGADAKLIVDNLKNGAYEENGKLYYYVNGIKTKAGVVDIDGELFYFGMNYYALPDGEYDIIEEMTNGLIPAGRYIIKDYKITFKNGIYEEGGKLYYYENNVKVKKGVVDVDGELYYFSMRYYALPDGEYYISEDMTNGLVPAGNYIIKDGKLTFKNGIYEEGGKLYYYVNNIRQKAGVVPVEDGYYYFSMKYYALENGTYYLPAEMTNGLLPAGEYLIENYKIVIKNGIYEEGGKLYYYENNVKVKKGAVQVGDDIYYFSMKYYALADGTYYIPAEMTNGLISAGTYTIKDGKIVL